MGALEWRPGQKKTTIRRSWDPPTGLRPWMCRQRNSCSQGVWQSSGRRVGSSFTAATVRSWSSTTAARLCPRQPVPAHGLPARSRERRRRHLDLSLAPRPIRSRKRPYLRLVGGRCIDLPGRGTQRRSLGEDHVWSCEGRYVDLVEEGYDIAIRVNPGPHDQLVGRAFCTISCCWWARRHSPSATRDRCRRRPEHTWRRANGRRCGRLTHFE